MSVEEVVSKPQWLHCSWFFFCLPLSWYFFRGAFGWTTLTGDEVSSDDEVVGEVLLAILVHLMHSSKVPLQQIFSYTSKTAGMMRKNHQIMQSNMSKIPFSLKSRMKYWQNLFINTKFALFFMKKCSENAGARRPFFFSLFSLQQKKTARTVAPPYGCP